MFTQQLAEELEKRKKLTEAWERKYGEPVPRVIAAFLHSAPADQVISRFGDNPGLHVPEQEIGHGVNTAAIGLDDLGDWEETIVGFDDGRPEISGDPKSLAEKMVPLYRQVFEKVRGRKPTAAELECVLAVGRGETMWGTAKFIGGLGPGMHNHGAVQCHKGCDESNSFLAADTHPLDSGGSQQYEVRFRRYPNDEAGIADLIKSVGNDPLRMLARHGNLVAAFSLGMFGNRYYEMFNAPASTVAAHRSTYNWIMAHATNPGVPGLSESFLKALARAKEPNWAGRVLMHSIAINKNIEATCRSLGVKRATRFDVPLVGAREILSAGAGAAAGLAVGGPMGAGVGALVGAVVGRLSR